MSTKPKVKTLHKEISKGGQSVAYAETLEFNKAKLRISIYSDAYDFQSHARIEAFSPTDLKWNRLASIHYGVMKTRAKLYYLPDDGGLAESHFMADRDNLLQQAVAILG